MGKSKLLIVSVSSILLVAVIAAIAVISSKHGAADSKDGSFSTSSKAIQSVCQPTDYKDTCATALSSAANDTDDPKRLVKVAFHVTVDSLKKVLDSKSFDEDAHKEKRTAEALENCRELLNYAVSDISQSVDHLGELDAHRITKALADVKVWLGAAITNQETCLDGFENTTTDTGAKMRSAMKTGIELSNNILAIVSEIGDIIGGIDIEGLLSSADSFLNGSNAQPSWVSSAHRRLLQMNPAELKPNLVVAQDGTGDCITINECLLKVPKNSSAIFVMYIKAGVYKEQVIVGKQLTNLMMVGDGPSKTTITGSINFIDGITTFRTATVGIIGDGFIAKDIAFENTAGAIKHQAVALRVQSDMSVFYNCRLDGYQDTLYAHSKRQFYRDCTISGTIDFIFGTSPSVFQNCLIQVRLPLSDQQNIVTAQGRNNTRDTSAIIIHNCTITAEPSFAPVAAQYRNYLGRPWKEYSKTIYIQSYIDSIIHTDGWLPWFGTFGLDTCYYAEVDNRGPGSDKSKRVTWKGVKTLTYQDVIQYGVQAYIQGNNWLPKTGVPFMAGLLPEGYGATGSTVAKVATSAPAPSS